MSSAKIWAAALRPLFLIVRILPFSIRVAIDVLHKENLYVLPDLLSGANMVLW